MYLYNFDMEHQKIIQYNDDNSDAMIVDLFNPLLSFVNCDFSKYDILRRKIRRFIQKSEQKFEEMDSTEIEAAIKKDYPDFNPCGIDNGETWWIAELCIYLYSQLPYEPFFFSELDKNAVQNKSSYDYLYWQKIMRDKVEKILDTDNNNFIADFSPMCRLNHYYGQTFHFNEIAIIHPTEYEKHINGHEFFVLPFKTDGTDPFKDKDYVEKEPQRQEFTKKHLHVINGYKFNSLEEFFDCEIFKMAQIGINLKKCENCGKYFIFNPNKPARYCSNKLPGVNMTCQQVASQKNYKAKQSPIQKAYINALKNRNKWYPSKKSGLRTTEQTQAYEKWKKTTSEIRDMFQQKYDNAQTDIQRERILEEFKQNLNE